MATGWWRALVIAVLCGTGACSDETEPEGECFDYSKWDGSSPPVSLRNRLLNNGVGPDGGLLRRACNASACHGNQATPAGELYLGPALSSPITETQITLVLANLRAESKTNGAVMRVVPFEPENSFLMRKLDGCYEGISAGCKPLPDHESDNPCGDRMPQGSPLSASERNEIRRWIAQGATAD